MRAAAEGVEARAGTGQTVLKPPEAGELEVFCKAQHETDNRLDNAVPVVMDPQPPAPGRVLALAGQARNPRVLGVLHRGAAPPQRTVVKIVAENVDVDGNIPGD